MSVGWLYHGVRGLGEWRALLRDSQGGQLRLVMRCVPSGLDRHTLLLASYSWALFVDGGTPRTENVGAVGSPSREAPLENGTSSLTFLSLMFVGMAFWVRVHISRAYGFLGWYR